MKLKEKVLAFLTKYGKTRVFAAALAGTIGIGAATTAVVVKNNEEKKDIEEPTSIEENYNYNHEKDGLDITYENEPTLSEEPVLENEEEPELEPIDNEKVDNEHFNNENTLKEDNKHSTPSIKTPISNHSEVNPKVEETSQVEQNNDEEKENIEEKGLEEENKTEENHADEDLTEQEENKDQQSEETIDENEQDNKNEQEENNQEEENQKENIDDNKNKGETDNTPINTNKPSTHSGGKSGGWHHTHSYRLTNTSYTDNNDGTHKKTETYSCGCGRSYTSTTNETCEYGETIYDESHEYKACGKCSHEINLGNHDFVLITEDKDLSNVNSLTYKCSRDNQTKIVNITDDLFNEWSVKAEDETKEVRTLKEDTSYYQEREREYSITSVDVANDKVTYSYTNGDIKETVTNPDLFEIVELENDENHRKQLISDNSYYLDITHEYSSQVTYVDKEDNTHDKTTTQVCSACGHVHSTNIVTVNEAHNIEITYNANHTVETKACTNNCGYSETTTHTPGEPQVASLKTGDDAETYCYRLTVYCTEHSEELSSELVKHQYTLVKNKLTTLGYATVKCDHCDKVVEVHSTEELNAILGINNLVNSLPLSVPNLSKLKNISNFDLKPNQNNDEISNLNNLEVQEEIENTANETTDEVESLEELQEIIEESNEIEEKTDAKENIINENSTIEEDKVENSVDETTNESNDKETEKEEQNEIAKESNEESEEKATTEKIEESNETDEVVIETEEGKVTFGFGEELTLGTEAEKTQDNELVKLYKEYINELYAMGYHDNNNRLVLQKRL